MSWWLDPDYFNLGILLGAPFGAGITALVLNFFDR